MLAPASLLWAAKVTTAGNRDVDGALDLGDRLPIGPGLVALGASSSMDREAANTRRLQPDGHLKVIPGRKIPTEPDLDGDRERNRADDCLRNATGAIRVTEQ